MTHLQARRVLVVGFIVALGVGAREAQSDEPAPPVSGPRVRLTVPSISSGRLVGTIVGLDEASLTLQRQGAKDILHVPRGAITTIEVSRHRSRRGTGAAVGALVGLGAAVAVGLAAGEECGPIQGDDLSTRLQRSFCFDKGESALITAILTVPVGTLLGLVAAPGEKWEVSTPSRLRVAMAPARGGGVRAVLSIRF